ncbi:MDR family MFS transporter [Gordoniibacillus kamchatkensis]|uniref:MDR family MFS transporter n=1 Tax=Gordoniibacillus kamchatkensis TaxID=1590651 RepID=UPI000696C5C7|nr:MDR family MFS transporter [Paenibacillus sp. VKM B-2647]
MDQRKLYWTLGALLLSLFLSSLDQTIVSTALPTIVQKLGGLEHISWVFTVYMLTSTSVMPVVGKLSDLYGRKRFYLAGLLIFLVGSALCGASQSMEQLIVFRGIQGIGAGMLMANTFTMLFTLIPMEKAGRFQAMFMSVLALSSVLGPTIGAFITSHFDWRWNFYINAPLGLVALAVISWSLVEAGRAPGAAKPKIDYAGALLLVVATVSILLALKMGNVNYAWSAWPIVGLFAAGGIALIAFLLVEHRAAEPILPLGMFRSRTVAGSQAVTFVQGILMFGALLYIPLFVQGGMGGDVSDAGNALTPMMLSVMAGAAISSNLMRFLSWRACSLLSMVLAGAGVYVMTTLPLDVGRWTVRFDMILLGVGIGVLMPIAQTAVTTAVEERYQGVANSTVAFFRSVGGVLGSAIMAAIVNRHMTDGIAAGAGKLGLPQEKLAAFTNPQVLLHAEGQVPAPVMTMLKSSLVDAIHTGFWFLTVTAAIGVVIAMLMGSARFDYAAHVERRNRQAAHAAQAAKAVQGQ